MSSSIIIPANVYWVLITAQAMPRHLIMSSLPRERVQTRGGKNK